MKRMLFNGTHSEELRVAIVDGQKLIDIDIEAAGRESRKSNIYKGVITRVEPSLEACFVNYGEERHGFLPFKEISRTYFKPGADASRANMRDALSEGMELLVQIDKEERGTKGAALTTFVSLAGRYLVLMPNNPRGGGVSRRIEGEDRQELRETMDKLEVPSGMSMIARTAGIGRSAEELQWDLNYLLQLWHAVEEASKSMTGAFLIYQESSLVIRAIRDYFTADIGEILIDTDDIYDQACQFMGHVMPDNVSRVKRYRDDTPLFSRFQIEHQIETAHARLVPLPSGGAIVIDHTEALVSIDVNSARATRGSDIEETALKTNLEAAEEAARQMRLRDLGGLIVIDFIDMESAKNQREVEQRLKEALHYDRARVQTGKISRFGLMELSRQRLRPALAEGSHIACPRCNGTGFIRDTESAALHVLRVLQEEAMKDHSAAVYAQVPVEVATYLLNEKRTEIAKMEARLKVDVVLIPNKHLETPHYKLDRVRHDDERLGTYRATYTLADGPQESDDAYLARKLQPAKPRQEAMVKGVTPAQPAPVPARPEPEPVAEPARRSAGAGARGMNAASAAPGTSSDGLFGRILGFFRRKAANEASASPEAAAAATADQPVAAGPAEATRPPRGEARERGRERGGRNGDGRGREARPPRDDRRRAEGRGEGRGDNRGEQRTARENRSGSPVEAAQLEPGADAPVGAQPAGIATEAAEARPPREPRRGRDGEARVRGERPGRGAERGDPARASDGVPGADRADVGKAAAESLAASALASGTTEAMAAISAENRVPLPVGSTLPQPDDAPGQASPSDAPDMTEPAGIASAAGRAETPDRAESVDQATDTGEDDTTDGNGERRRRRRRRSGRRDRLEGREADDTTGEAAGAGDAAGAVLGDAASAAEAPQGERSMPPVAQAMSEAQADAERIVGTADEPENRPKPVAAAAEPSAVDSGPTADEPARAAGSTSWATSSEAPAMSAADRRMAVQADAPAQADTFPSADDAPAGAAAPAPADASAPVDAPASTDAPAPTDASAPAPAAARTDAQDRAPAPVAATPGPTAADQADAASARASTVRTAGAAGLQSLVAAAGLQLVETRSAPPDAQPAVEEPIAPRAPRVRRRREAPAAEPLQQVETARDDGQ